jgi:hypothetical protein
MFLFYFICTVHLGFMVALTGGCGRRRLGADGGVAGGRGDASRVACVRRSLHVERISAPSFTETVHVLFFVVHMK